MLESLGLNVRIRAVTFRCHHRVPETPDLEVSKVQSRLWERQLFGMRLASQIPELVEFLLS